jgi:TPP-dependent trihydroxycyclohexane-1,2-dione (THcHDO) dehydratase
MGALTIAVESMGQLRQALADARACDRTTVIVTSVRESDWTEGGASWKVGVPEASGRIEVLEAHSAMQASMVNQRRGI